MCSQHGEYWCPSAKAPGHQYPQCWLNINCIAPDHTKILHLQWTTPAHKILFWKKWSNWLRVNHPVLHCVWSESALIVDHDGYRCSAVKVGKLKVQLTINQHWFSWCLGSKQASSHFPNRFWPNSVMPYSFSALHTVLYTQWVKVNLISFSEVSCLIYKVVARIWLQQGWF